MLFLDDQLPLEWLSAYDDVQMFRARTLDRTTLLDRHADALIIRSTTRVDAALMHDTSVRFVATATAGTDHLDAYYLQSHGIVVAHAGGSNANAVAEYCIAAMESVLPSLAGLTLSILGFGHVGSLLAVHAHRRGMHIIANDPPLQECGHAFPSWCTVNDVEACIRRADVLSVHVPLTTVGPHATRHLLSADLLAALPEHALLINAARGEVIATEVLHHEITNRRRQCVLDVWEHEPHIDAELALHATIATPHIAGHSAHAWQRGAHMAAEAWLRWKGLTEADISDAIARHTIPIPSADVIRPVVDESVAFKEALLHAPSHEVFETMRRSYRRRPEFLSPH